jgi:hypothetical protein
LVTTVVPNAYIVGTSARAAAVKSWPMLTDVLPFESEEIYFYATQDCVVNMYSMDFTLAQASGKIGAGTPMLVYVPAGVQMGPYYYKAHTIVATRVAIDGILQANFMT